MMNKPTVDQILELYDETKNKYAETTIYGEWEKDETFYELDFKALLQLPAEFQEEGIVLPTARDIVDTCTDNTDIYNVRVWTNRKGTSKKSEEEQNLLRKFGLGVIYRNNVEATISPLRTAAKHYWMHGMTVIKTIWDADKWVDRPAQEEGESDEAYAEKIDTWRAYHHDSMPIIIQAIHPKNIMLDLYHEGGSFIFETREELCFNVNMKYGKKWSNSKGRKTTDRVEHISFWTKDFRCELYDREPVLKGGVVKHDYGFIPYTIIETGLGNLDSKGDLSKRYVGVLRYVRDMLISESRDYSYGDVILKYEAFPWGYLKGDNAQGVTEIFKKFGQYNPLPAGVEIVDMNPKVPPDALLTWLGVASNYLSSHAAPRSVQGLGEQGVRSGADRRLVIAQASVRYQYSNEAFKHGVAKVLSNCARIMKNVVPGSINVWSRTPTDEFDIEIKKDKMNEPFTFYVEFAPISEEDEYRRHDDLERLTKSGLVNVKWARKQMSNIDPDAMELEDAVEMLKTNPAVQQILAQYVQGKLLEALTKKSRAESIEEPPPPINVPPPEGLPAQGGGQTPGRRMAPPTPTTTPGGEMQNQLGALRSPNPINPTQGMGGGGNRR